MMTAEHDNCGPKKNASAHAARISVEPCSAAWQGRLERSTPSLNHVCIDREKVTVAIS